MTRDFFHSGEVQRQIRHLSKFADFLSEVGEFSASLEVLKLGAYLKDPDLTWRLADALYYGLGTRASKDQGIVYYKRAAKMGVAEAHTSIGKYNFEKNSDRHRRIGIAHYRKAAKMGEPHAMHNLGVCYSTGIALSRDLDKAFLLFKSAADLGHTEAQFKTGWCLWFGEGTKKDTLRAKRYLAKAAKEGNHEAKRLLAKIASRSTNKRDALARS